MFCSSVCDSKAGSDLFFLGCAGFCWEPTDTSDTACSKITGETLQSWSEARSIDLSWMRYVDFPFGSLGKECRT